MFVIQRTPKVRSRSANSAKGFGFLNLFLRSWRVKMVSQSTESFAKGYSFL